MKKSIRNALIATALLTTASMASAAQWQQDYSQGIQEYFITNAAGATLTFTCDEGGMHEGDKDVILTTAAQKIYSAANNNITFNASVDGKKIQLLDPTSMVGMSNWDAFWKMVIETKSTSFTVVMGKEKYAFPLTGVKAILADPSAKGCLTD